MIMQIPRAFAFSMTLIGVLIAPNGSNAQPRGEEKPDAVIKMGEELPKCPVKISENSPRLCLRGNVLNRLFIPAGNPWYYAPCFADGRACVELRYFGL